MLIVDKHCIDVNLSFFNYSKRHWIIVLILSSHYIYQLQLWNVDLFLSFSKAISKELLDFMMKGQEFVSISKRIFYQFFNQT